MLTEYSIIHPDGTIEAGTVEWPQEPGYHRIVALVEPLLDGEPLEHVTVLYDGRRHDMFVSEQGHLHLSTRGPLAHNDTATKIYRTAALRDPAKLADELPSIVGVAVLFHRLIWF
jgi:hypothetical protein